MGLASSFLIMVYNLRDMRVLGMQYNLPFSNLESDTETSEADLLVHVMKKVCDPNLYPSYKVAPCGHFSAKREITSPTQDSNLQPRD